VNQIVIVVLIVGMIGLMFWNTRKQKQQREEVQKMRDSFTPGMLVRTGSGFLGTIEHVDTDSVVIRSEDGSLSRWMTEAVTLRTNPAQSDASRFDKSPVQIESVDDREETDTDDGVEAVADIVENDSATQSTTDAKESTKTAPKSRAKKSDSKTKNPS
jgi:preprotein translocase subunit YajC